MRFWIKHDTRRRNFDGTTSVYCQKCGREIIRQANPLITSVQKCQMCVLKEQGVINAEDYVLAQYRIPDTGFPVPISYEDELASGVLLINPEERFDPNTPTPPVGGIVGTVRSVFRVLGFALPKPVEAVKSKQMATEKRAGLFGPQKSRR